MDYLVAAKEQGVELKPIYGGFHLKELGQNRCVHVMRMLVNWRLAESLGPCDHMFSTYGMYWCYQGSGLGTFLLTVGQALAWDGTEETLPQGWIKNYKGERGRNALE